MWEHHTDTEHGWKYSITSDNFFIQITGGSIKFLDHQTKALLKQHKGHHYLYTGDISPDETQCFALENGKHFYVYSLKDYELIKRVTLPRGYESIDMYGHYSEDGSQICIPAQKWIGSHTFSDGYYEYVMCRYDAQQLSLIEKVIIENPKCYRWPLVVEDTDRFRWKICDPQPPTGEVESFQRIVDIVSANLDNKDFTDRLWGLKSAEDDPAVAEIMKLIFGKPENE